MQTAHTLCRRIPAGKHDPDSCKILFNICTPIILSACKRSTAQFFFLFTKRCHLYMSLKYAKLNLGFQNSSTTKECQMAVESFVFLKSKVSRRKNRDGRLCPLSLDHSELFQVAGIMSKTQLCYVLKWCGC